MAVGLMAVLLTVEALLFFALDTVFSAVPLHIRATGGNESLIGLVTMAGATAALLTRPLLMAAGGRWGQWALLGASGFGMLLLALLYLPQPDSVLWVGAIRALHQIPVAGWIMAGTALLINYSSPRQRGTVLGWWGAVGAFSLVIAPPAGIRLYQTTGFEVVSLTSAACALAGLIGIWVARLVRRASAIPIDSDEIEPASPAVTDQGRLTSGPAAFFGLSAMALTAVAGNYLATGSFSAVASFLPLYAIKQGHDPSLTFLIFAVASVISRLSGGWLADRFGRRAVAVPSAVLLTLGLYALARPDLPGALHGGAGLVGVGVAALQTALLTHSLDWTAAAFRTRLVAVFYTLQDMGFATGALLAGWVVTRWDYSAAYLTWSVISIATFLLALLLRAPSVPAPASARAVPDQEGTQMM